MNIEIREKDDERAVFVVDGVDDTFIGLVCKINLITESLSFSTNLEELFAF